MLSTLTALWQPLASGLPILLLHFVTTVVLLALGGVLYVFITPFRERELIAHGNVAAGLVLGGALLSFAIPLAATLATTAVWLDIILWGSVAVLVQLLTFVIFSALFRRFRHAIEHGNIASALLLVGLQLSIAVLNAGAMAG